MRPDNHTIEQFRKLDDMIGHNIDNLIEDFEKDSPKESMPQAYQNAMFTAFVLGVIVPMSPDSNFNRKFKRGPTPQQRMAT